MLLKGMKLRDLYGRLTSEKRIQFWTITSTVLSTVLTFWLGFTIQYFVLEKTSMSEIENEQNLRFQLVNQVYPIYQKQHIENSTILSNFESLMRKTEGLECNERIDSMASATDFLQICQAAINSAYIMDKARFCFDDSLHQRISNNNMQLLIGVKFLNVLEHKSVNDIAEINIQDSISSVRRICTVTKDPIREHKLDSLMKLYMSEISKDNTENIDSILRVSKFKIMAYTILPGLENNEDIMKEQLHTFIKSSEQPTWSNGLRNAFSSINKTLVSGSNLPHLIYSLTLLVIILLLGTFIWLFILRMVFSKEDNTLLTKPYVEIEQEISALKQEINRLNSNPKQNENEKEN